MEHSSMRPDYFAIYPDVFSIPYLATTDLFAEELFRVEVPDYAIASAGPVQGVWRADWRLAGSGGSYYQPDVVARTAGLEMVDSLDVADLDDEAAHRVKWWQEVKRPGFPTEVQQLRYRVLPEREAVDGGRLLTGGMNITIDNLPDAPLWVVARLHAREAGAVLVTVGGVEIGRWAYPQIPGQWLETLFPVPSSVIRHSQTEITLRVDSDNPAFRHYAPYYLWFLQGEPARETVVIKDNVDVSFAEGLSLLGFDLTTRTWRPGDVLPLSLYWQATSPTDSDAKVFAHLYDSSGELVGQSDSRAYFGTRPPYTWSPDEIVVDPRRLVLPDYLMAGQYAIEVGLYRPDGSGRLPAYRNGVRQAQDRVVLATIEVRE
jgi:hypothetical protein